MSLSQPTPLLEPSALGSDPTSDETHIGAYRVVRRLEVTPTSESVLAISQGPLGFERSVVIKRLLAHAHADPKVVKSFGREAAAYARLTHPAIVRLYDFFQVNDQPAMVLEHIEAIPLARLFESLREKNVKLPIASVMFIGARIFAALAAAHSARDPRTREFSPVIHRDVSPGNVLLTQDGDVRLTNFGFAKLIGTSTDSSLGTSLAASGYMAPEQLLCSPITVRTDVYAAALVIRELLTGEPAFARGDGPYVDFLQAIASPNLAPIASLCPLLPAAVASALTRALEPDSEKRDMTAVAMQRIFNAHREGGRAKLAEVIRSIDAMVRDDVPSSDRATELPSDPTVSETRVMRRIEVEQANAFDEEIDEGSVPPKASEEWLEQEEPRHRFSTQPSMHRARSRGKRLLMGVVSMGIAVACFLVADARPQHARGGAPAPASGVASVTAAPPAPISVQSAFVQAALNPPPSPAPTSGELRALASSPPHRVYVDGKQVGVSGAVVTLPCGSHAVRIGSAGKSRTVDIPCGGAAEVTTR